ncbi:ketopantoate reductase family protein [Nocardioides sp. AX2bis]|uniref:ketopantoate reductase family protein n=1 Tax=Nocardioides sp. AX2bis TaxID=2653157 RepID=UPI001916B5DD|nr:2-dehydropantoate 2-reductase [Nocardioides sp. AX2bis]
MRYVVLGAGAVGGVVGARLHDAGTDVTLVARGEHLAAIRRRGLRVDRPGGVRTVAVDAVGSVADATWTDDTAVLLAVKSHQTRAALDDLVAHAPATTAVVCVQNGLANEPEVLRRFARTYAVCVMLPCTHLEPGLVVEKSAVAPGVLDVGRVPGGTDDVTAAVSADLRRAGFESEERAAVTAWKRRKLLMNLGNGVDAAVVPGDDADELVRRARAEGEALFVALGLPCTSAAEDRLRRGDLIRRRDDVDDDGGSTWQSLTRGTASEIDYLAGEVVLLGRLHGVPTPVNAAVQALTRRLAASGGRPRSIDAASVLGDLPTYDEGPATSR